MLAPTNSESTLPAATMVDRPLIAADLTRLADAAVAVLLPIVMPDLGVAGKLLGLTPERASTLARSDLGPKIESVLTRVLALSDAELAVIVDALARRAAAWRRVYAPTPPSPELAAALEHLRAALT